MGSISHQLSNVLRPHGGGGEGSGRTGMLSAGRGGNLVHWPRSCTPARRKASPQVIVHESLALVPGKEKNISATGHENMVPLSRGREAGVRVCWWRRGPGGVAGTVSVPHACPAGLRAWPCAPPGDTAMRASGVCEASCRAQKRAVPSRAHRSQAGGAQVAEGCREW